MKNNNVKEVLLVFLIVLIAYGYFYTQDDVNSNTRLAMVKAVVEENRFEIDSYQAGILKTDDKSYYAGHYYTDKAIGSSLIGIEFYSLIYRISGKPGNGLPMDVFKPLITFFAISLLCAFLAPLLFSFVKQVSNSTRYGLLVTLAICLGTPLYIYSAAYYGHSLVGMFLFVAFVIWFQMKNEEGISPLKTFLSGYLLGYAVITEYPTALIVLIIGLYILFIMWKKKKLMDRKLYICLILGAAIPVGVFMLYNHSVYGNPLAIGYADESSISFRASQNTGLMGIGLPKPGILFYMTFHTTMGIFWQSPILLLAFLGWFAMLRNPQHRPEAIFSFTVILLYFVLLSGYYAWWGGLAFTPRHILPALPFFSIPLAFLPERFRRAAFILALISIGQMFIVVATRDDGLIDITINYSRGLFYKMFQNSTIYNVYLPNFLSGKLVPNLGQEFFNLTNLGSLTPLFIVEAVLLASFIFLSRPQISGDSQ